MTIKQIKKKIDAAMTEYSKVLEIEARKALLSASKRHPTREIIFCSAMGSWSWNTNDQGFREFHPVRAEKMFDEAFDEYKYGVIPAPIRIVAKNGVIIEERTDW